ncbi:MAGUK p55 subfamily member 4-like, partial [Pyxicephalus adspersus]|uniref:MAGUK p55 subfamily member 4-like n=1 Tax=Pyxicephalus adspersus TaxID=30357 RepID=UPI003B5A0645
LFLKGATIKRHEITGDIIVARVIHGGLADRSGLLYAGDKLVEVNGVPVDGLEPEQVIQILVHSEGTIVFKVIPVGDRTVSSHTMLFVRAMADYWPQQDPAIPCADAGLPFKRGEILQIVDQSDSMWWQARKASDISRCAGLIPSNHLLKRKQREFWWSQPFMSHSCPKASQCEFLLGCPFPTYINYSYNEMYIVIREVHDVRLQGNPLVFYMKTISKIFPSSFLEYGDYKGHMYGTSIDTVKDVLEAGKICIIDLEPQGITGARTHELKPYVIFIKPPSRNCMRQTRRNASMITDYFVNMKFKVT